MTSVRAGPSSVVRRHLVVLLAIACASPEPSIGTDSARARGTVNPAANGSDATAPASPESTSIRFDATGRPILPLILRSSCEGSECRIEFDVTVNAPTELLAAPEDGARVVTHLVPHDKAEVEVNLVARALGIVVIRRDLTLDFDWDDVGRYARADTIRFAAGDTIFVVGHSARDGWRWSLRGTPHRSGQFWSDPPASPAIGAAPDTSHAVALSRPRTEEWWYVRPAHGAPGWWHYSGRWAGFEMVDDENCPTASTCGSNDLESSGTPAAAM